jgi:hypothetical protein
MAKQLTVYHGTSHAFRAEIEDHGLRVRPGLTRGVRVALRRELALAHAAAYCAYIMLTQQLPPKALIAAATIDERRVREGAEKNPLAEFAIGGLPVAGPALTVPDGLRKDEIRLTETELKFLYEPAAAKRALDMWERLTDQKITIEPTRPGGRGRGRR